MLVDGGGSLGCRLRLSARRTFPSFGLDVVFVATWRLQEAALIKTHPSHFNPPPSRRSSRSFKKNPSPNTERGVDAEGEMEDEEGTAGRKREWGGRGWKQKKVKGGRKSGG